MLSIASEIDEATKGEGCSGCDDDSSFVYHWIPLGRAHKIIEYASCGGSDTHKLCSTRRGMRSDFAGGGRVSTQTNEATIS